MGEDELKKKVDLAKAAVEGLDPELKKIAFQTILDKLLANESTSKSRNKVSPRVSRSSGNKIEKLPQTNDSWNELMEKINRTKYPKMYELMSTLDRSLYVLQIMSTEFKKDGLTSPEIAELLTERFRKKTTSNAVSMALMNAHTFVDRKKESVHGALGFRYHLMHEGEVHIKKTLDGLVDKDE